MERLGLGFSQYPFEASTVLTSCFQFQWQIERNTKYPTMLREAGSQRGPVMAMKVEALAREELLHELRSTLPDFLSSTSGRTPIPRARWKELWIPEPKSIQALESQLVKLVEQALWAMVQDPAYTVPVIEEDKPLVDALTGDSVPFQDWMQCDVSPKTGESSA